jgi:hypothetical protein
MDELKRINEICEEARRRMDSAPYSPHLIYAEVFWMTEAESIEFFELRRSLINEGKNGKAQSN